MSTQNLVSATLAPEAKAEVIQKLEEIRGRLGFLLSLEPDEVQALFKAGNGFSPFIDKAYFAATAHPEIMSGVFDLAEFKKDYALAKDLSSIAVLAKELNDGIQNTLTAVNSDAMAAALEVYATVKLNRDKVPGLKVVGEDMAVFFKRAKKAQAPTNA